MDFISESLFRAKNSYLQSEEHLASSHAQVDSLSSRNVHGDSANLHQAKQEQEQIARAQVKIFVFLQNVSGTCFAKTPLGGEL